MLSPEFTQEEEKKLADVARNVLEKIYADTDRQHENDYYKVLCNWSYYYQAYQKIMDRSNEADSQELEELQTKLRSCSLETQELRRVKEAMRERISQLQTENDAFRETLAQNQVETLKRLRKTEEATVRYREFVEAVAEELRKLPEKAE